MRTIVVLVAFIVFTAFADGSRLNAANNGDADTSSVQVAALLETLGEYPYVSELVEGQQLAVTCFKTGETISGMNKICYYDCLGSAAAITISAVDLCPLTIEG